MKIIVCPDSLSSFNCVNNSAVSCGVKTAVGSSSIKISQPFTSAFTISTFCLTPTVISWTLARGLISNPYFLHTSSVISIALFISNVKPLVGSIPNMTFSATVKEGTSIKCWCTIPIPASIAFVGEVRFTLWPLIMISP